MPRVKARSRRAQLLQVLGQEARQFSTATIMLHAAIAERLGLNITDHKAADLLTRLGPMSAGELAEHTGLTTGAVTGIIDRLEKAGFARRENDPHDRRRVIVRIAMKPELERRVNQLFEPLSRATAELAGAYSDRELAVILDFMKKARAMSQERIAKLRAGNVPTKA
jgi:DNA-binding MarR family transcriptional regulator